MFMILYMATLFVLLTPGVLMRFPKGCSKLVVAATHGVAFVAILWLTRPLVMKLIRRMGFYEGFQVPVLSTTPMVMPPPLNTVPLVPSPSTGPVPMPSQSISLAPMNISLSTSGSGKTTSGCKTGNDCASGICMAKICI